jgi:hypothetical protein
MRIVVAMLALCSILALCAAFELKMTPKSSSPCKDKLCYAKYLEKMLGFINGTNAP